RILGAAPSRACDHRARRRRRAHAARQSAAPRQPAGRSRACDLRGDRMGYDLLFHRPFVVVHAVEGSGFLTLVGGKLVTLTGGNLVVAATIILWVSAILSAVIDNIPFVATMIPLIKGMAPAYGGPGAIEPLWWSLSLGACLGGNGTLTGASANLAVAGIAERNGIRF